ADGVEQLEAAQLVGAVAGTPVGGGVALQAEGRAAGGADDLRGGDVHQLHRIVAVRAGDLHGRTSTKSWRMPPVFSPGAGPSSTTKSGQYRSTVTPLPTAGWALTRASGSDRIRSMP